MIIMTSKIDERIRAEHAMGRALASAETLALARELQRAAFACRPDRLKGMEGDFEAAPLYLSQAISIVGRKQHRAPTCRALVAALEARPPRFSELVLTADEEMMA